MTKRDFAEVGIKILGLSMILHGAIDFSYYVVSAVQYLPVALDGETSSLRLLLTQNITGCLTSAANLVGGFLLIRKTNWFIKKLKVTDT